MNPGTKISQLDTVSELSGIDYFPIARGGTTKRISGLTLIDALTSQVPAPSLFQTSFIEITASTLELSSTEILINTELVTLSGTQVIETSSTEPALRITQTGTGNALVVEDDTHPDSTPLVVTNTGVLVVGRTEGRSGASIETFSNDGQTPNGTIAVQRSGGTGVASFVLQKSLGTVDAMEALTAPTSIGSFIFSGYDGTQMRQAARITGFTDGDAGVNNMPGRLSFFTTLSGAGGVTERMRIDNAGNVGIGTTAPNERLTVSGNISASTVFANLSGNCDTTTRWLNPRQININGDITGATTIDGTQDVTITTTLSTDVITNANISPTAQIIDTKLATITTPGKVSLNAIDVTASTVGQTLVSNGPGVTPTWQSRPPVTTQDLTDEVVTTLKVANGAITLEKTNATSNNIVNSLVSRNEFGEFSGTAFLGNVVGNAETATKWITPRQVIFEGAITGAFAIDGSNNVIVPVEGQNLASAWINFNGTQTETVSCKYTQSSITNVITINTPVLQEVVSLTGVYTQGNFSFPTSIAEITLTTGSLVNDEEFLREYLLGGNQVTLTFLSGTSLIPEVPFSENLNGAYTIQAGVPQGRYFNVNVNTSQVVSGEVIAEFVKVTPAFTLNHLSGHIVKLDFIDGLDLQTSTPLPGGSLNSNGLYTVLDSISSNIISVSSTLVQESSGNVNIIRNTINKTSNIVSVTPKNTGNYILNIYPSLNSSGYSYVGTTRVSNNDLSIGAVTTLLDDIKTKETLEIRTVVNNGSLNYYDSNDVNVIIYG